MGNFLSALGDQISSQFSLGENTNHSLDSIDLETGKNVKYGSLGDFAQHFDQSAERRYVEEGYLRKDPYNTDPKQYEILMQEPNATVLLKKKMFSSVSDNFRPDFMDADEKLYFKAMKVLFQNKCAQIASLEKLSKIQKITSAMGSVSDQLMPIIISLSDGLSTGLDSGSNFFGAFGGSSSPLNKGASDLSKVVDRLRRIYAFNQTSGVTSWITDSTNLFQSQFGQGTGVIELTNFTSLNTTTSVDLKSAGGFSMTIMDPYEAMLITEYDIEKAISDATNMFYNSKISQFAKESSAKLISDLQVRINQTRAARNASPISIKLSSDTLIGKRVTAIIDRLGIELPFTYDSSSAEAIFSGGAFGGGAQIPPGYLKGGEIAGNDGLDPNRVKFKTLSGSATHLGFDSEVSLFNRLISTIFSKLSQDANSQGAFQLQNVKTNYTRRKLRFNFSGKLIIQPMDPIHIYMNSKSRFDTKLLSGLNNMFTGLGMLQNLNNTLTGLANTFGGVTHLSTNVPLQVEKAAFVGSDFPNYLWLMMRGQFISENEGTSVFGGVVERATDTWADGKFRVEVTGKDNTIYFEQGKVNFKPGLDTFNGSFFDPLTPFKTNFDTVTSTAKDDTPQLLDENKYLLGAGVGNDKRTSLIKNKLGRYAGELANENNIVQDRSIDPVTGRVSKIFYAPDGLVYKWKEGIGIFTQYGSNRLTNDPSKVSPPNLAKEPFAGQDVMNVLSLLISGVPYNFATYYKATHDASTNDPQSKQNSAHSFAQSLKSDLARSNTLWGNFIPFKNLMMNESAYVLSINAQTRITQSNNDLNDKIRQLQDLNQRAIVLGGVNILSDESKFKNVGTVAEFATLHQQIQTIQKQVDEIKKAIAKENNDYHKATGDDISFDSDDFIEPSKVGSKGKSASDPALRRLLRRQLNFLTRRMSYNVRANEDKNLFIVDDSYDKDYDIQAFEKSLSEDGGPSLYNNEFTSVKDKISLVSGLLNLEVFCDTQGHIRVRSPQYNRMPSSVFYKMMHLKQVLNIQVFPQFLDDLFNTKLSVVKNRIEILEDLIRLDCAILGKNTDETASFFILEGSATDNSASSFSFISNSSGTIVDIQDLLDQANPDSKKSKSQSQVLTAFAEIKGQALSTKDAFTASQKYDTINLSLTEQKIAIEGTSVIPFPTFLTDTRVDELVNRIQGKSGAIINKQDYLIKTDTETIGVQPPIGATIDTFKVVSEMSDKIRERQKLLKLFYNTIKNAQEFKSLDDKNDKTGNQLLAPGVFGKSDIPEVFEHMIEDESYDDYGTGSGTRYIIKRSQIKNISISENPPPWTSVEVQGVLSSNIQLPVDSNLNSFPGGGNAVTTALAIDYDMWRNYGFREAGVVHVPFLSNPNTQCAPYANMLLSRNRKDILRGSVTISGNEFMQPGEVVFIEDRGLLFYVTSVKHTLAFGTTFQTTLELTYGHTPGEYIPNVLDMIGKLIYNNKDTAQLIVHRQETSANEVNVGVLHFTKSSGYSLNTDKTAQPVSSFAAANSQVINNILFATAPLIAANTNDNTIASIELRTYFDKTHPIDDDLQDFANDVRNILIGATVPSLNSVTVSKQGTQPTPIAGDNVKTADTTQIDLDNIDDRRSPSQKAIDEARNLVASKGSFLSNLGASLADVGKSIVGVGQSISEGVSQIGGNHKSTDNSGDSKVKADQDLIRKALIGNVVDCWVVIESKKIKDC